MKLCNGCLRDLPESSFYWDRRKDPNRKPVRRAKCIECYLVEQNGRNQRRLVEARVYHRQWRNKRKAS